MLQLKHMNFKFSYLFLIRKPLQLHKSSLFQININSLSPDPENIWVAFLSYTGDLCKYLQDSALKSLHKL